MFTTRMRKLAQVVQGEDEFPIPGNMRGQAGQGCELPDLVEVVPSHGRGWDFKAPFKPKLFCEYSPQSISSVDFSSTSRRNRSGWCAALASVVLFLRLIRKGAGAVLSVSDAAAAYSGSWTVISAANLQGLCNISECLSDEGLSSMCQEFQILYILFEYFGCDFTTGSWINYLKRSIFLGFLDCELDTQEIGIY